MRIIWDEWESYRPDPICSCDLKCVCDVLTSVMERKQQDCIMQFLRGLNDQFNTVRSNVLMMDPLPNIAKVLSYAIQQERQISSNELIGSISLINAAGINSLNSRPSCTYYGKDNHIIDICYRNNGFSHNYASRGGKGTQSNPGRGNSGVKGNKVCTYCGFLNHTVDDCYKKHGYPPRHKLYKVQNPNINNVSTIREEGDGSPLDRNQETQNEDVRLTA